VDSEVSIRDLRNHGGEIVDRAAGGERIVITRSGKPVAELRPVKLPMTSLLLLERWKHLPAIDAAAFRRDVDGLLDQSL
jgi:prevent-host-death family protein